MFSGEMRNKLGVENLSDISCIAADNIIGSVIGSMSVDANALSEKANHTSYLLAKFKWDFPDTRSLNSSASTLPRTGKSIAPLVVPCNGELEDMQEFSFSTPTAPNSTVTSLMDSWTPSSSVVSLNPPVRTNAPLPPTADKMLLVVKGALNCCDFSTRNQ
ncbi:hypothetical protein ACTXT7_003636 [Hymenolepis weldensis]